MYSREYSKKYYNKNKQRYKEIYRKWYIKKKDGMFINCKNQYERVKEMRRLYRSSHPKIYTSWEVIRKLSLERDNFICKNCGRQATEVHHIDGSGSNKFTKEQNNELENLMSVCHYCNIHLNLKRWGTKAFNNGKYKEETERNSKIMELVKTKSQAKVAREMKITRQRVNQIVKRLTRINK